MKSALENMILKYLDKKTELPVKERISGLAKEFKMPQELATEWVEKTYPRIKDNMDRVNPQNKVKKNSYSY